MNHPSKKKKRNSRRTRRLKKINIGDYVIFKVEAISRCKKSDDMWDRLIGKVIPGTRYLVVGKNWIGHVHLNGWDIVSREGRLPISVNPSVLKKC